MKTRTRIIYRNVLIGALLVLIGGSFTSCYKKVFEIGGRGRSTVQTAYTLSGTVKDASDNSYISSAKVVVISEDEDYAYSRDSIFTDDYGYYSHNMSHPGNYTIRFSSDGYQTMEQTITVEVVSRGETAHYPMYVAMQKTPSVTTYQTSQYNVVIYVQEDNEVNTAISEFSEISIINTTTQEDYTGRATKSGNQIALSNVNLGTYDIVVKSNNYYDGHTILKITEALREGDPSDIYQVDYSTNLYLQKEEQSGENKYYISVAIHDIQTGGVMVADEISIYRDDILVTSESDRSSYRFTVDPGQYSVEVLKASYQTMRINVLVEEPKPGTTYLDIYMPSSLLTKTTTSNNQSIDSEVAIISDGTEADDNGTIHINSDRTVTIHSYKDVSGTKEDFSDKVVIPSGTTVQLQPGHENDSITLWRVALEEKVEDVNTVRVYRGEPDGTTFDPAFQMVIDDHSGGLPLYMYYKNPSTATGWDEDYVKDAGGNNIINNDDVTDDLLYIRIPHFSEFCVNLKITEWKETIVEESVYIPFDGYNGTEDTISAPYGIMDTTGVRFDKRTIEDILRDRSFTPKQTEFLNTTYTERIKFFNGGVAPVGISFSETGVRQQGEIAIPPMVMFDKIKKTRILQKVTFKMMNEDDMEVSFSKVVSVKFTIDEFQPIGHGATGSAGTGVGGGIYISD